LEYFLFIVYLFIFAWLVTKIRFFTGAGLSKSQLVILFLLKVIAGIFYGWMGLYYGGTAQMLDTWAYHYDGIAEYKLLGSNPHEYVTNLFHNPYPGGFLNFFGSSDSYWNDLKSNIFIKLLSVFDIFSFGYYYVNVIFYCFIGLFGPVAIYRVMNDAFPGRKTLMLAAVFFIPSFFYWSSGLHKEGLIFTGIGLIIYHVYFASKEKKISIKRCAGALLGVLILLVLRNFVLLIILPAIIAWLFAIKWPRHSLACFSTVYIFFCLLFFTTSYIDKRFDFPQAVVDKQHAFMQMQGGNSSIPIKQLEPTAFSFLINTPQAITLSAARPYPSDIKHFFSLAAAVEINLMLLLMLVFLFRRRKEKGDSDHLFYFCIFFSFSLLLAIGFSVNNLGAIVRYRSIIIPFLIAPLVARIDWNKLFSVFSTHSRKA
jgi:hypothetical protein